MDPVALRPLVRVVFLRSFILKGKAIWTEWSGVDLLVNVRELNLG